MPTDANTLYEEAKCFICRGLTQVEGLTLALMARWLVSLSPSADTTPEALETYGSCFLCYTGGSLFDLYEISLLDQIANA